MTNNQAVVVIREARCEDSAGIAAVHVASWRSTYRGLLPDNYLEQLAVEPRERYWAGLLCAAAPTQVMFVAESQGQIVGFAAGGAERSGKYHYQGEVYAIYLLEEYQRQSIGRRLIESVASRLAQVGMNSMLIWVLTENPARRFYEALGGSAAAVQLVVIGGTSYEETGYGWANINALLPKAGRAEK